MLTAHTQSDHHRRHNSACPPADRPLPLSFSNHTSTITTTPQNYLADLDDAAYLSSYDQTSNNKLLRNYFLTTSNLNAFNNSHLSTQPFLDVDPVTAAPLMTSAYDFQGPAIRIQQSTPVPQIPLSYDQHSSMLATAHSAGTRSWDLYGGGSLAAANNNLIHHQHHNNNNSLQAPYPKRSQTHQRAQSTSSLASSGSSQYPGHTTATAAYSYSGIPDNSPPASSVKVESSYSADQAAPFSNHLPTPSQTPTSDSFLSPVAFQTFGQQGNNYDNTMAAHFAMKHAMMDTEEDVPGYTHSSRQSVSSYGNNSPATPRTVAGDDFDDKYKSNGEKFFSDKVESWMEEYLRFDDASDLMHDMKMDGSTPDSFPTFYNQQPVVPRLQTQAASHHGKNSLLSPYRSVMAERLQAAQIARSQSPISSASRAVSPFRHGSPLAPANNSFGSPRPRFGAPQMREQTSDAAVKAFALKNHSAQNAGPEPKTISPKDALLEYNESEDDAKMPLFPADDQQFSTASAYESMPQNFDTSSEQSFVSMAEPRAFGQSYATAGVPSQATFNFAPPSIPGSLPVSTGLTFASQPQYRTAAMSIQQESTPEFPAHLTSMDSSASEAGGPQESNGHSSTTSLQKPGSSAANTGTYSCTYHGCPLRFETPQKLQKHKREGHRQNTTTTVTSGIGSGMSADELLARNSQAGPHKCERINPTTGKPCNTIFSRPYDLTRHEDTIHNARKQKVRCALCVEEKTFSRNDALTRHMRVVHPEVDFPGKHRRRGHGSHE